MADPSHSPTELIAAAARGAADAADMPPRALAGLADAALAMGLIEEADALWAALLARNPAHPGALKGRIEAALARGEAEAALPLFETARPILGGSDPFELMWARALEETGDRDGAIDALRNAISGGSRAPALQMRLATMLADRGDRAEADAILAAMLGRQPGLLEAHRKRANLAFMDQDSDRLLAVSEAGLAHFPGDPVLQERLATALQQLGRTAAAIETLEAAIAQKPDHVGCRIRLARLMAADGRDAEADAMLAEALQHAPGHRGATLARIELAEARGDRDAAVARAREAVYGAP